MKKMFFAACFLVFASCQSLSVFGAQKQAWLTTLQTPARFQLPLLDLSQVSQAERLRLSQAFAQEFRKQAQQEVFVDSPEIRKNLLLSGRLVPSCNYMIQSKSIRLGDSGILKVQIVFLETGEILSVASHSLTSSRVFTKTDIQKIVRALVFQRNDSS